MRNHRVVFLDQVGEAAGGAEQTLATFLRCLPRDITPWVVLFEDGAFANRLRGDGLPVEIAAIPDSVGRSTRERMQGRAVLELLPIALRIARILRTRRADLLYTNSMKAHLIGSIAARLAGVRCLMHFHDIVEGKALLALRTAARLGSRERIACSRTVADRIGLDATTPIYAPLELKKICDVADARGGPPRPRASARGTGGCNRRSHQSLERARRVFADREARARAGPGTLRNRRRADFPRRRFSPRIAIVRR